MFSVREFVMCTLEKMRASEPEWRIRDYALKWYAKSVLTDEDLATVEAWYAATEPEEITE